MANDQDFKNWYLPEAKAEVKYYHHRMTFWDKNYQVFLHIKKTLNIIKFINSINFKCYNFINNFSAYFI